MSRLLTREEFGTAIAITAVLGLAGLITDFALDRFVIIKDTRRALSTAHFLSIWENLLLALSIIAGAPLLADLFGVPGISDSFALAGATFAIAGLANLSIKQIQRNYEYGADSLAQMISNSSGLAALCVAAYLMRNHIAIVIGMAVQTIAYTVLSHVLARFAYRVKWDKQMLREALSYGIPLTLNGIGLAVMYQLDRVLVGYWFGVRELANYAVIFSISVVPTNLVLSVFSSPSLSFILTGSRDRSDTQERYRVLLRFYAIVAAAYTCFMVLTLDVLTPLLFGPTFTVKPLTHILFAIIACFRLQRGGAPTALFLARSKTKHLAVLNLASGLGLAIACGLLLIWPRVEAVLLGIAIGELIAFVLTFVLLEDALSYGPRVLLDFTTTVLAPGLLILALYLEPGISWPARGKLLCVGFVVIVVQSTFEFYRNARFRDILLGRRR